MLRPLLLVTAALIGFFMVKTEPLFRRMQQRLDALNGVLQKNIAGARLVKSLARGPRELERFGGANDGLTASAIAVTKFSSTMMPALTMCIDAGMVVVIGAGGLEGIRGQLSLDQIVALTNYLLSTMTPLSENIAYGRPQPPRPKSRRRRAPRQPTSSSFVLVLDEATRSVDTRTEARIQRALSRLMHGRTSFVIAHRLSTIRHVPQILFINDGTGRRARRPGPAPRRAGLYPRLHERPFRRIAS